ncbi:HEAT repeat domain-containing protein [Synechococcus sp. UW140]|uniref:HEAT repeat domain-containing protein n=1 Tax=Synechococcus sp. UW140 TaxID=368503 RepID=UPI000E0E17EF|nr:HEAT repeat domain-containing protein [Synechococcus sp. UW140]
MSQFFVGGVAFILAFVLYSLGRRPSKPFLRSTDVSSVAALNRAQVELVQAAVAEAEAEASSAELAWQLPMTTGQALGLKQQLHKAMNGGPDERLEAVVLAGRWGDQSILPLLRRGLRDADSRVMEAAAVAMAHQRGATRVAPSPAISLPPNASKTL